MTVMVAVDSTTHEKVGQWDLTNTEENAAFNAKIMQPSGLLFMERRVWLREWNQREHQLRSFRVPAKLKVLDGNS